MKTTDHSPDMAYTMATLFSRTPHSGEHRRADRDLVQAWLMHIVANPEKLLHVVSVSVDDVPGLTRVMIRVTDTGVIEFSRSEFMNIDNPPMDEGCLTTRTTRTARILYDGAVTDGPLVFSTTSDILLSLAYPLYRCLRRYASELAAVVAPLTIDVQHLWGWGTTAADAHAHFKEHDYDVPTVTHQAQADDVMVPFARQVIYTLSQEHRVRYALLT